MEEEYFSCEEDFRSDEEEFYDTFLDDADDKLSDSVSMSSSVSDDVRVSKKSNGDIYIAIEKGNECVNAQGVKIDTSVSHDVKVTDVTKYKILKDVTIDT